jgi:spore coat polysaccharide biosynthesis protein SpsF
MTFRTEQENFWAGEFGNEYTSRNIGSDSLASRLAFLVKALAQASQLHSCIEFGANVGMNLKALQLLYPKQDQYAIEINPTAAAELAKLIPSDQIHVNSILDFTPDRTWDLVLITGVLVTINPDWLPQVYEALYQSTGKYLLISEYYNPSPVTISYRGHTDRLFKRDFCGEILDQYPDLKLIDYGFIYRRDPNFPLDDPTWFLMEKRG